VIRLLLFKKVKLRNYLRIHNPADTFRSHRFDAFAADRAKDPAMVVCHPVSVWLRDLHFKHLPLAATMSRVHNRRLEAVEGSVTTKIYFGNEPTIRLAAREFLFPPDRQRRECAKLWAGLVFGDEMDNQAGI
jgi:hypothetical protein